MDLKGELELEQEYEDGPLVETDSQSGEFEGKSNFWRPTEQTCPTFLIKELKGFESLDYRLRSAHYKVVFDFLGALKKAVDDAKKKNAQQMRFAIQIHGLSDRIGQPEVELGVSVMRALEVARFAERVLPQFGLHHAEPPKSRTDETPPSSIEEIAMFISAAGSSEHLQGTGAANRRVIVSACSQQV